MKYRTLLASALVCCLALFGCTAKAAPALEDYPWTFQTAQTNNNGEVLFCSAELQAQYAQAAVLDLWVGTADGQLLITDNDAQSTWSIHYLPTQQNGETSLYRVTYAANGIEITSIACFCHFCIRQRTYCHPGYRHRGICTVFLCKINL